MASSSAPFSSVFKLTGLVIVLGAFVTRHAFADFDTLYVAGLAVAALWIMQAQEVSPGAGWGWVKGLVGATVLPVYGLLLAGIVAGPTLFTKKEASRFVSASAKPAASSGGCGGGCGSSAGGCGGGAEGCGSSAGGCGSGGCGGAKKTTPTIATTAPIISRGPAMMIPPPASRNTGTQGMAPGTFVQNGPVPMPSSPPRTVVQGAGIQPPAVQAMQGSQSKRLPVISQARAPGGATAATPIANPAPGAGATALSIPAGAAGTPGAASAAPPAVSTPVPTTAPPATP